MTDVGSARLVAAVLGVLFGYGCGRLLFVRRHVILAPWPVIALIAVVGLLTLRLFSLAGVEAIWQLLFFPLLVGWGAGLAMTPARLPRQAAWWQVWKQ
jgi:hypothetical protein